MLAVGREPFLRYQPLRSGEARLMGWDLPTLKLLDDSAGRQVPHLAYSSLPQASIASLLNGRLAILNAVPSG